MFGFKQIKEFNVKTVTQEVAAELCAIAGLWSSYTQPDNKNLFTITNEYSSGSINCHPDGVRITHKSTTHIFKIWENGHITCSNKTREDSEFETITRNKKSGKENKKTSTLEYHCDQIKYVSKLCELGFYKFDLKEEKLKRLLK